MPITNEQIIQAFQKNTIALTKLFDKYEEHDKSTCAELAEQKAILQEIASSTAIVATVMQNGLGKKIQALIDHNTADDIRREAAMKDGQLYPKTRMTDGKGQRAARAGGYVGVGAFGLIAAVIKLLEMIGG